MYKKAKLKCRVIATETQAVQMATETTRLIASFRPMSNLQGMINAQMKAVGAPDEMQIKSTGNGRTCKIFNWQNQGVIPYHYAAEIVKIDAVKKAGFTIKSLRPDVNEWNVVE